jgi:hypothetical protein
MRLVAVCAGAIALTGMSLAGCTTPAAHHARATPSASAHDGALSAKAVIKKIMASSDKAKAIASAKGTIDAGGATTASAVVADVLKVDRMPDSTVLTWRLKSADGGTVPTNSFQLSKPPFLDTRYVGLIDASTKKTYFAYTYAPAKQVDGADTACLCSGIPDHVGGDGTEMHSVMPPLPSSLTAVDVTIPGFDAITGVKVANG